MIEKEKIIEILESSPSVELLKARHRAFIIEFFIDTFKNRKGLVGSEFLHTELADFLEERNISDEEENEHKLVETYEERAMRYIKKWTAKGFLRNYPNNELAIYELTQHTHKTIDWLNGLIKKQFVGTESRFRDIFKQLNDLIEFTNEDKAKRLEILKQRKLDIEHQIQQLEAGEDVKVLENYQIIEKFDILNQSAKELLTDFKEVEVNFKEITKEIYQKHADSSLSKGDILQFTFDALHELKNSNQGKSFYAFWRFLMNAALRSHWEELVVQLFRVLAEKEIPVEDIFLKDMKSQLYQSAQKVYRANDKMAQNLSRIIKGNQVSQKAESDRIIREIKKLLGLVSKERKTPPIFLEIEEKVTLNIPFERRLTLDKGQEVSYDTRPKIATDDLTASSQIEKVFNKNYIDKRLLVHKIHNALKHQSQTTLAEVIEKGGGIEKGLSEVFGYLGVLQKFTYHINSQKNSPIVFDKTSQKSIRLPEIIILK